ncbi:MAG: hypothetical protein NTY64_03495 [Deltaproteobacteria bacterium]|nr:hypothetical protein [Deltaproteobacteria bacterium]
MANIDSPAIISPKLLLLSSSGKEKIPTFQPGEILDGVLIEQLDPEHAILRIKGQSLLVENQLPLPEKSELTFQVEEVTPKVILRLLSPEGFQGGAAVPLWKRYLAADVPLEKLMSWISGLKDAPLNAMPAEVRESFTQLLSFFSQWGLNESLLLDPTRLKEILLQSGLFLESKLSRLSQETLRDPAGLRHDFKSLLLQLQAGMKGWLESEVPGPEKAIARNMTQGLDQLLQKLELYQILNTSQTDLQDKMFFLIPTAIQNQPGFIELGIFFPPPDPAEQSPEETALLFLLHLPDWGKMKIEVKVKDRGIYSQFILTDPRVVKFIEEGLPALAGRFQEIGYQPHLQAFWQPKEKIESSLLSEIIQGSSSLFNIVI